MPLEALIESAQAAGVEMIACKMTMDLMGIEKEELIFTLDTTKKVEQLAKSKNHKALGEYVKEQLLDNTHSFSDKFSELNNR